MTIKTEINDVVIAVDEKGVYYVMDETDCVIETTDKEAALTVFKLLYSLSCAEQSAALHDDASVIAQMANLWRWMHDDDLYIRPASEVE